MKSWMFVGMFVSVGALAAACSTKAITNPNLGSGGDDNITTGAGNGTTGTGTTGTGTTGTGTTGTGTTVTGAGGASTTGVTTGSMTTGGTGGAGSCDAIGTCQDPNNSMNDPTLDCASCAEAGECASQFAACGNDPDCIAFDKCLQACAMGDMTCEMACQTSHSEGATTYNTFVSCVICQVCPNSCMAAQAGCM